MNKFLIVANWKLNGNIKMISNFLKLLKLYLSYNAQKNTIVIAPPNIYLERTYKSIENTQILIGSQNVDLNLKGAFTGETSILMLKDIGVKYVIIGHSERRMFHYETDDVVTKKFILIKKLQLIPIVCIGETEKEKKYSQTEKIITKQLNCILHNAGKTAFRNTVIAYEPLWAIGTGISANPKDVQLIHQFIKNYIEQYDSISAKNLIIQYGGSVNEFNTKSFLEQLDINGLLIGSASLKCDEFIKIMEIANNLN